MNPLQLMMMQMMMDQGQAQGAPGAAAPPQQMPGTTPQQMPGAQSDAAAAMLGSVQAGEPHTTPLPYTTTPDAPRALNPGVTQNLLQMLMQSGQAPQMQTLGQLLRG